MIGLGDLRDLVVRAIKKVQRRVLVREEREVEDLALVPAVGAGDGEAALDGELVTRGINAERRIERAVRTAAALERESAVPLTGKRDGEFDRVRLAAETHVLIDDAGDLAALGQRAFERGRVRELRRRSDGQLLGPRDGDREGRQRKSLERVA